MTSLDVDSLFTKNCVNKLLSNNFYSGKLTRIHDFLKLPTTESSFIFDNKL